MVAFVAAAARPPSTTPGAATYAVTIRHYVCRCHCYAITAARHASDSYIYAFILRWSPFDYIGLILFNVLSIQYTHTRCHHHLQPRSMPDSTPDHPSTIITTAPLPRACARWQRVRAGSGRQAESRQQGMRRSAEGREV